MNRFLHFIGFILSGLLLPCFMVAQQQALPPSISGGIVIHNLYAPNPYFFQVFISGEKQLTAVITIHDYVGMEKNSQADSLVFSGIVERSDRGFRVAAPTLLYKQLEKGVIPENGWFEFEHLADTDERYWRMYWLRNPYPAKSDWEIFTSGIVYQNYLNLPNANLPLSLHATDPSKLFSGRYKLFTGVMRHRACTGTRALFHTELFLQDDSANENGFRQFGIFRFSDVNLNASGSLARGGFIVMRVGVFTRENGTMELSTYNINDVYQTGNRDHYASGGSYQFALQPLNRRSQLSGFMRGPNGSRGQFLLELKENGIHQQITKNNEDGPVLQDLRNQLAALKKANDPVVDTVFKAMAEPAALFSSADNNADSKVFVMDTLNTELKSLQQMLSRNNDTLHRIQFAGIDSLEISFFDNAVSDGDSISVFVNDELVVDRSVLSARPLSFVLSKEWGSKIVIKMLAENLGSIPPNTAVMVIRSKQGTQSYPMRADLGTNGCVLIMLE
jgi:hypothetical protein